MSVVALLGYIGQGYAVYDSVLHLGTHLEAHLRKYVLELHRHFESRSVLAVHLIGRSHHQVGLVGRGGRSEICYYGIVLIAGNLVLVESDTVASIRHRILGANPEECQF